MWQTPSYAAIEYGGRWKAVMYAAKRDCAPRLISGYVYPWHNGTAAQFGVYAVNDGLAAIDGRLTVDVRRWADSSLVAQYNQSYHADALQAVRVWVTTVGALLNASCAPVECYAVLTATWSNGTQQGVMCNVVYLTSLKDVDLPKPAISIAVVSASVHQQPSSTSAPAHRHGRAAEESSDTSPTAVSMACDPASNADVPCAGLTSQVAPGQQVGRIELTVGASVTSPWTWLETAVAGRWSDNALFLVGGEQRQVSFTADEPFDSAQFLATVRVRDVWSTYHRP